MNVSTNAIPYLFGLFLCLSSNLWAGNNSATPFTNGTYQGDVVLNTQADIDAFNYESINGNLQIGYNEEDALTSDIYNLKALKSLKRVTGKLEIQHTQLTQLEGLNNLTYIGGSLYISKNHQLHSFFGLENLATIEAALAVGNNSKLNDIDALRQLKKVHRILFWDAAITSLEVFQNLTDKQYLSTIHIENCDQLSSLKGLEKINAFYETTTTILLLGNDVLTDISALAQLRYTAGKTVILDNPLLETCCPIRHLMDADLSNGQAKGNIIMNGNAPTCNTVETILATCPTIKNKAATHFTLYPNPATEEVVLDLKSLAGVPVNLSIHNQLGQQIWQKQITKVTHNQETINVSVIPKGLYFLRIESESSGVFTKELVISRPY